MRRTSLLTVALLPIVTTPIAAQRAILQGMVTDATTLAPIAGASVRLHGRRSVGTTDEEGRFRIVGVRNGDITILINGVGYQPGALDLRIAISEPVVFELGRLVLNPVVTELDPIEVEAAALNRRLDKVGFFSRMHGEAGTFITRADIDKLNPARTSELLRRVAGFNTAADGSISSGRGIAGMTQGFSNCGVDYYIDGIHSTAINIDVVMPTVVAGIEVYSGAASIPPSFRITGNPKCGVVVIWTRGGRGTERE